MTDSTNPREIPFGRPMIGQEEKDAMSVVLSGHILTHGPRCAEFEEKFAARIGVKHAITTSSCTTALHLSLMAIGIEAGDEVIVPAETHVATAHSVEHQGAKPVFVDVQRETGNIDPDLIEAAITDRTRAIIVVHYLGLPCDMDAINAIADRHDLKVLEDCALALGATWDGKNPGGIGVTGSFSFYPTKHMTTLEGGMLTTNDDTVAALVRQKRAFGYDKNLGERSQPGVYDIAMLGYNYRMSEGHAAVGICQLDKLDGFIETRKNNTDVLLAGLAEIPEIKTFPIVQGKAKSGFYCVNAVLPEDGSLDRAAVVANLNAAGVGTSVHYPVALPLSRYYREKYPGDDNAWPVANWISTQTISLPVGPHLDTDDMAYICDRMKAAVIDGRN
jgi:perosamine synthetase